MDILVKQFTVRREGRNYGPQSIIQGVPDEEAAKLIAESNGALVELPAREAEPETDAKEPTAGKSGGKKADDAALPNVDPAATVK